MLATPMSASRSRTPQKDVPDWAMALKLRRIRLQLSQEGVAAAAGDVLSQKAVSDLENGRVFLGDMSMNRVVALARALRWTLPELQAATGVDLGLEAPVQFVSDRQAPVYPLAAAAQADPPPLDGREMLRGDHPDNFRIFRVDVPDMDASTPTAVRPGEHVYVNLDEREPHEGHVYVIVAAGRPRVRRWAPTPFGHAWVADNREHDPIPPASAQVLGRIYRVTSDRINPQLN